MTDQKQMKFSFTELKRLISDGPLKDLQDAKNYILKFFYPLTNGMIMFVDEGVKKMISIDVFKNTYAQRFGKDLSKWFSQETTSIYGITVDTQKPFICNDNLNIFHGFKHKNETKYIDCSEEAKAGAQMMLSFIHDVWCNANNDSYNYVLDWLSNMIKGHKNNTILYLKSFVEGIGKSTVTQFLMFHVLGRDICIESNSDVLKSSFNEILAGKLMVIFEELENGSDKDWQVMSTKLKRWSTSTEVIYSDKYLKSYESKNINNYIINTNVEAIKASEGRRYYILDLSTQYKNNHKFFNKLYKKCFNDEVGQAFYLLMMERDTAKFNPQNFIETQAKKIAQSERLHPLFKFLKFNYILDGKDLCVLTKDLYEEYLKYAALIDTPTKLTKNKMIALFREHGIEYKTSNGKMTYNLTNAQLRDIGNKYKFFFDDDNEEHDDNRLVEAGSVVKFVMTQNEIKMAAEIERLKSIIEELQKNTTTPEPKKVKKVKFIEQEPEPEPEPKKVKKVVQPEPKKKKKEIITYEDEEQEIMTQNLFTKKTHKVSKNNNIKLIDDAFENALNKISF